MSKNSMVQEFVKVGVMAALAFVAMPELAVAQQTSFGQSLNDFMSQQLTNVPRLITALCYIAGLSMMASGALKLKAHAENATQTPLQHGIARLLVGGSIAALPTMAAWVNKSTTIGGSALKFDNSLGGQF